MIYIGNHLSSTGGFEAMGKQALKLGADTFAFFTRNPRGGKAKEIDKSFGKEVIVSFHENNKRGIAKENNMIQNKPDYLVPVFADEICARFLC